MLQSVLQRELTRANKVARELKALAAEPETPTSVSGTHMVDRTNAGKQPSDVHTHVMVHAHYIHTHRIQTKGEHEGANQHNR